MSILRDARKIVINDGQFTANDNRVTVSQSAANFGRIRPRSILHILHSHSAVAGLLNASEQFDAPKCDPDTRVAIIETITDWVQAGNSSSSSSMFWLHGPAGVGKSAVAQEVALLLDKERNHAASFFFSRTAVGRNNGNMLVVTLAYQIAMNFPPIRTYIAKSIKHNPAVFTLSNKVQMQKLIIEPVNKVRKSFTYRFSNLLFRRWNQPRLIVVDGLDECDDPQVQCDLLTVIGQAIQQLHMPFRFLITSRPESHILSTFQLDSLFQPGSGIDVTQRNLGEDSDANDDIRTFLHKAFKEIQRTHPLRRHLPEVWPIPTEIEQLIQKSSGNFIYPSTVIRYIQSPLLRPHDCLRVILGLSAIPSDDRPYGRLDDLYYHIFSSIPAKHKESIKLIFDILVIPRPSEGDELGEFTTPSMLEKLLSFPTGHVEHILGNLLCLVNLHGSDKPVKILHASLADFLLDSSRSGEFHADMGRAHQALARGYTRLILEAKPNEFAFMANLYYLPAAHHSERALLSGLEQHEAYGSLDELYIHIFSSAPDSFKESLKLNFIALALLASPDHKPWSESQAEAIEEKLLSLSPGYGEYVRGHLSYLVVDHPLRVSHHSVLEFSLTPHRSGKLGVDMAQGHELLARGYATLIRDEDSFRHLMTDRTSYPLHFMHHSERAWLSEDLETELEDLDLADIYHTFTQGSRVFDGIQPYSMFSTILNSFFHLLQRKDIENGPRLFYNHIERLEQHILSSRQGVPDIDLNLYSRMLDRIRSWRLEYECSGPARSQGYPCGSCQNSNISGAPEAVYKLKILVTIAWHSSSEYWMDSTTRPHMVKRCLRPLEKLENFHDHRDGVAIHLELAVTSLAQSSYSSSLVDYLASLAGLKSGRSQVLLVALSREYPSGLSTLASAVLAYIQRFGSDIQLGLLRRLLKRWSHFTVVEQVESIQTHRLARASAAIEANAGHMHEHASP